MDGKWRKNDRITEIDAMTVFFPTHGMERGSKQVSVYWMGRVGRALAVFKQETVTS